MFTTLKDLISSSEFSYLELYPVHGDFSWEFPTRSLCNSAIRFYRTHGFKLHCCFNPSRNSFCPVLDKDYKEFKRCSSFVKKHFDYFERIGIL